MKGNLLCCRVEKKTSGQHHKRTTDHSLQILHHPELLLLSPALNTALTACHIACPCHHIAHYGLRIVIEFQNVYIAGDVIPSNGYFMPCLTEVHNKVCVCGQHSNACEQRYTLRPTLGPPRESIEIPTGTTQNKRKRWFTTLKRNSAGKNSAFRS